MVLRKEEVAAPRLVAAVVVEDAAVVVAVPGSCRSMTRAATVAVASGVAGRMIC